MRRTGFGLLVIPLLVASGCARAESLRGQALDPPRPVPELVARDHWGGTFRFAEQRGRVVLLFFGYTTCPDVCPATLARWKKVREKLGSAADRVRFVFVTVDPERDTPAKVKEYLELFSSQFVGLVGREGDLMPLYRFFGVLYEKVPVPGSAAGYLVNHTAAVPVVDPQGRWRLRLSQETSVEDYVHDVRVLLRAAP